MASNINKEQNSALNFFHVSIIFLQMENIFHHGSMISKHKILKQQVVYAHLKGETLVGEPTQ